MAAPGLGGGPVQSSRLKFRSQVNRLPWIL